MRWFSNSTDTRACVRVRVFASRHTVPGPAEPLQTIDALLTTARGLAENLTAMVQDAQGLPLSPLRAAALREDIARFQAQLA